MEECMYIFIKKIFFLLLLSVLFVFLPFGKVHAAENFTTDYRVIYAVSDDGTTHASINVTMTNQTSDYYASSYKIQLGFENLVNVEASDGGGKIIPVVTKADTGQIIEVKFNKKVVGLGNKNTFKITFDTPDITEHQGRVWEINIPGIADQDEFESFDVELQVPKSFGQPAYIKPADFCLPKNEGNTEQNTTQNKVCDKSLTFTKEQLGKSGISISFGDKQIYDYRLIYHLRNTNLFPIRTEIALPPDTNYQEVSIESIKPEPQQVRKDKDGNWLAEYQLMPSKRIDIEVKGKAELSLYPKKESMTEKELAVYLEEKPYWQLSNGKIASLAKELRTPKAIYDYVVKTLTYDFSRVTSNKGRLGAVGVLNNPNSAVCLEFTDLFVALARAAGIPAREVDGYAYTENPKQRPLSLVQDILHAWPEYYDKDKQTWVMIDPTWGNTTGGVDYFDVLDFDHFVFVKKGESSDYPIPAGGYKVAGDEYKKDVHIAFANEIIMKESDLQIEPMMADTFIAGLPISGKVTVVNKGPKVSRNTQLHITADSLTPRDQVAQLSELLPYERREIGFDFDKQSFLTNNTHTITMKLAGKEEIKKVRVMPLFVKEWRTIGGIFIVVFTVIILVITIKTGRLRLS